MNITVGPFKIDHPAKSGWFGMWYQDPDWMWYEVEFSESNPIDPEKFPDKVKCYLESMIKSGASGPEPLIFYYPED